MSDEKNIPCYDEVIELYLPDRGEGKTKATQIVTAVNKLIYKWFNDGDVYDNTYHMIRLAERPFKLCKLVVFKHHTICR